MGGDRARGSEPLPPDAHVCVRGLDKLYQLPRGDTVSALRNVDLDIRRGEFVSGVGPRGCGKSTLLKCIAGIAYVSDGETHVAAPLTPRPPTPCTPVFPPTILL